MHLIRSMMIIELNYCPVDDDYEEEDEGGRFEFNCALIRFVHPRAHLWVSVHWQSSCYTNKTTMLSIIAALGYWILECSIRILQYCTDSGGISVDKAHSSWAMTLCFGPVWKGDTFTKNILALITWSSWTEILGMDEAFLFFVNKLQSICNHFWAPPLPCPPSNLDTAFLGRADLYSSKAIKIKLKLRTQIAKRMHPSEFLRILVRGQASNTFCVLSFYWNNIILVQIEFGNVFILFLKLPQVFSILQCTNWHQCQWPSSPSIRYPSGQVRSRSINSIHVSPVGTCPCSSSWLSDATLWRCYCCPSTLSHHRLSLVHHSMGLKFNL